MLLYTAYGEAPAEALESTARTTGLERYLGYRPHFCSLINPDSLADTWFRIFAASPRFVQVIDVYEVDEAQAVPMDVVTWSATCLDADGQAGPCDDGILAAALNADHPHATDYLVPFDLEPARLWRFDVRRLLNGQLDGLGLSEGERAALHSCMARVRALPHEHAELLVSSRGRQVGQPTMETWYRLMASSGMVPFVWSHVLGRTIAPELMRIEPWDLAQTAGYQRAQAGVAAWDRSLGVPGQFGHAAFEATRGAFLEACDQLAHVLVERRAASEGTARNGTCFCGSGRKYKKCCMRKGLDALSRDW